MCGIVGAVAERDVVRILMEGLRRLEYRGYDSAGIAVREAGGELGRRRALGKVEALTRRLDDEPLAGRLGIAHTRWATHGVPHERNAHPHVSGADIALVHNGIIENHGPLKKELLKAGYVFDSDTDSEVIAHRLHFNTDAGADLFAGVHKTVRELKGAYALSVISRDEEDAMIVARMGCPVVIGLGIGENFVASDIAALLPVTRRFMFLEDGDVARVTRETVEIIDTEGRPVDRDVHESDLSADAVERGDYRHYMLKEIHEQPRAISETIEDRIGHDRVYGEMFGPSADEIFRRARGVHLIACGTSYHAAMVARYQIEELAGLPCSVEIASEYRYRNPVVPDNTLFVSISQSGETADTLAALRAAKEMGYLATIGICNVPESSLARESGLVLMTRAGPEIGVASTKAFTTQLTALILLAVSLARHRGLDADGEAACASALARLPGRIDEALQLDEQIHGWAEEFVEKHHALFLGRGVHYPIAMEGALKLKEISYIHAEAYASGELKHGPLALVDDDMPVIAVAPNDELVDKLRSNLEEVRARGGRLYIFADPDVEIEASELVRVISMPKHGDSLTDPAAFTVPLQLLAYHVAVLRGTDVDKPRNLAKSVTVE